LVITTVPSCLKTVGNISRLRLSFSRIIMNLSPAPTLQRSAQHVGDAVGQQVVLGIAVAAIALDVDNGFLVL
jgi:hypothetical protein